VTGGPEGRESYGGRVMGKATGNAWRMLTSIRPIPKHAGMPGRWHLVVGDRLLEFQAPFCDIKKQEARLIEWATGGAAVPDIPAMMLGGVSSSTYEDAKTPSSDTMTTTLGEYVRDRSGLSLAQIQKWRERFAEDFPEPIGTRGRASLYEPEDLDAFVAQRLG
jgi:hypothetical protein